MTHRTYRDKRDLRQPQNCYGGVMRIPVRYVCVLGLVAAAIACGGGGSNSPTAPGGPGSGSSSASSMTFRVDGTASTASSVTGNLTNGILSVAGTDAARATTLSFAVTPTAAGTGTYTLGPLSSANALIMIGNPAAGWQAAVGIGSGTITINTLTTTSASGTFSFTLAAVPGTGATGTKSITEGTFNVTFTA